MTMRADGCRVMWARLKTEIMLLINLGGRSGDRPTMADVAGGCSWGRGSARSHRFHHRQPLATQLGRSFDPRLLHQRANLVRFAHQGTGDVSGNDVPAGVLVGIWHVHRALRLR